MQVEIRYFRWNSNYNLKDIALGENIDNLLQKRIVKQLINEDSIEFKYTRDERISIGSENGIVKYIFFTKSSGNELIGIDSSRFDNLMIDEVCKALSYNFEYMAGFTAFKDIKQFSEGDYLQLIFKDKILANMFIIRRQSRG